MDLVQIPTPKYISGYAESRIGGRSENQDSFGYKQTQFGFLVTVCDGMGGGPGGKTASTIAVQEIIQGIDEGNPEEELTNIVIKAIRRANLAIIARGNDVPELKGMGSTCTVLLINEDAAIIAHVGDSRVYQLRGKSKVFRTFDHSMVFDLVRQGVITEEQARLSAQSNVITRALGIKPDLEVDVVSRPYLKGDRFLLCSDGIHGTMPEPQLIGYASEKKRPLGTVTDDIAIIVDGNGRNDGGGHDNLTLAIIETNINSNIKEKMSTKIKILLSVLGVVCAVSIIANIIAFSNYNKAAETDNEELNALIAQRDSLKDRLQDSDKNIQSTILKFKADSAKISDLVDENKKLRTEIDHLKQKKENNDKKGTVAKTDKSKKNKK